jgi:flavin reductase (DIM6/NTAB) family NADH-FMN oxidoreductase RutF
MNENYLHFDPGETPVPQFHRLMLGAVAPRPIALASTIDKNGKPNLSPFSFFNVFGANPPILIFSPARRGKDNTTKHTYENVKEVPEVVINMVNYSMVQQVSDASADFPKGVNEFEMVGLTMEPSHLVKPFRVKESPAQFECKVLQVIETGLGNAAGNLVICEILRIHVSPAVLDDKGMIDPHKIDLVGRLGGEYYVRASGNALFELKKPD